MTSGNGDTRPRAKSRHCDLVIVGGGPAGIAAACLASEHGKRVVLLDRSPWLGGNIWHSDPTTPLPTVATRWLRRLQKSGAEILSQTTVLAIGGPNRLQVETLAGPLEISWDDLILATGARELFIPFPGWTLPHVMGSGGLQSLSKAGWPVDGARVVVAGSGPLLLAVADGLRRHGAKIAAIVEQSPWPRVMQFGLGLFRHFGKLLQGLAIKLRLTGVPYRCGRWPLRAEGDGRVERVTLTDGRRAWTLACDYLACGFGLAPNTELAQLLGCKLRDGFVQVGPRQETSVEHIFCAGEPTGIGGADCAVVEGAIAGLCAADASEQAQALFSQRGAWHRFRARMASAFALRSELRRLAVQDTIVCRCEDVRRGQLEPYEGWPSAKLQTRCGMGPCQGRVCGPATEFLFGWQSGAARPPLFPTSVGQLAGPEEQA